MTARRPFIITGAGSDIGAALAQHLDARGDADLVLAARSSAPPAVAERHAVLHGIDLTAQDDLQTLAATVAERTTGQPTLIHCVGDFWQHRPLIGHDAQTIVSMITSHYVTLALTVQRLLPLMIERGGGRIVAFSCNSVQYNYPDMAPFTSAKAAVECFIKCIANECSGDRIVANTLALPTILTPKVKRFKNIDDETTYLTPEELAGMIVDTLATASPAMNGNAIKVFKHSPAFFTTSYYDRNPRELDPINPPPAFRRS